MRFTFRFQYRLRSLFLVMLLLSIPLSWLGARLQSARMEGRAVGRFRPPDRIWYDFELAGSGDDFCPVEYESHDCGRPMMQLWNPKEPPGPRWLRQLLGDDFFISVAVADVVDRRRLADLKYFPHLKHLSLWGSNATDQDLVALSQVNSLEGIDFFATSISDAGLRNIRELSRLRKLCLASTRVTDSGVSEIAGLSQLEWLDLKGTNVTDDAMQYIGSLPKLQWLDLSGTFVTDAGLAELAGLSNLKRLAIDNAHITKDGVQRLRMKLPKCNINRECLLGVEER